MAALMLLRVLYVSLMEPGLHSCDLERLVFSARRRNRQLDLTGALFVCEGRFVQALEGQEEAVDKMMLEIARDPRHRDLHVYESAPIKLRMFADWDMAFIDDFRLHVPLQGVVDGQVSPHQLLETMRDRVNAHKDGLG